MSLLLCMVLIPAYWQFFESFPHYLKTRSATRELSHSPWQTLVHSGVYRNDMSATRPVHIRNIFFPVNTHFWFSSVTFLTCFFFTVIWHQNKPPCWVSHRPFKMISRIENHNFNLTLFGTKHCHNKAKDGLSGKFRPWRTMIELLCCSSTLTALYFSNTSFL